MQVCDDSTWREAVGEFVELLKNRFGSTLLEVKLFGSRVRGDARTDSDIDVLVIVKQKDGQQELQIIDLAFDVSLKYGILLSPLIMTMEDYRSRPYLSQEIEREGISL